MQDLDAVVAPIEDDLVAWRRHLHAHPELSYEEHETSAWVRERLAAIGAFEVTSPTPTSVMARLVTGRPGRTVAIRADLDALPIEEDTGLPFASTRPGVMHACGHDGHTSILLGVATALAALRDQLAGELRLLWEHGEEALPGGASQMVAAGVMEGVDAVIGLHLWARTPIGEVVVRPGRLMAACDVFRIVIRGRGGHIGTPHGAIDPIAVGAEMVEALQHIVARNVDPVEPAIVGVTEFHAGDSVGVIPDSAVIGGGTNVFSPEVQDLLERRIGEVARGICAAHGATCEVEYTRGYGAVVNDPEVTAVVARTARGLFGDGAVTEGELIMAGEDFSAFQALAPGCFVMLGAANAERGITHDHHHPRFDVDEAALPMGVRLLTAAAIELTGGSA
ncbi:MAG TPA: amidohydrolase [Capillimicrobium sp.]